VYVLAKGIVIVPDSTRWAGPWLGATRAPSLQRVANRPIICHVLDALARAGVVQAAIIAPAAVAGEIACCVEAEGPAAVAISHLPSAPPGAEGDPLLAAAEFVGEQPCILHRADGLLGELILTTIEPDGADAPDAVLLVNGAPRAPGLRLVSSARRADEAQNAALADSPVVGACLLGPRVLARLSPQRQPHEAFDLACVAERIARAGGRTQVRLARHWRHFDGDAHDLLDMNRAILDTLDCEAIPSPHDDNHFEGKISIHPTARVSSSVIVGPVMIGADAQISDSYIGPHTSIEARVRVEGAELERSIVLADASVLHVGSRLVTSIVGRHARIFRDFSVPRALRLQVGEGDEVALC
jgi:glucose-1-phosphate thymidylyltransferase